MTQINHANYQSALSVITQAKNKALSHSRPAADKISDVLIQLGVMYHALTAGSNAIFDTYQSINNRDAISDVYETLKQAVNYAVGYYAARSCYSSICDPVLTSAGEIIRNDMDYAMNHLYDPYYDHVADQTTHLKSMLENAIYDFNLVLDKPVSWAISVCPDLNEYI